MDELEWHASDDPEKMLHHLAGIGKASERKVRLFAAACCRRIWRLLHDERSVQAVETAEQVAEGDLLQSRLRQAYEDASVAATSFSAGSIWFAAARAAADAARFYPRSGRGMLVNAAAACAGAAAWSSPSEPEVQVAFVRDIFGNPFRPTPPPAQSLLEGNDWLLVKLAEAAYEQRRMPGGELDSVRLAVLADALEEGGAELLLLNHLREQGCVHVRGCWVVDAVLGKS